MGMEHLSGTGSMGRNTSLELVPWAGNTYLELASWAGNTYLELASWAGTLIWNCSICREHFWNGYMGMEHLSGTGSLGTEHLSRTGSWAGTYLKLAPWAAQDTYLELAPWAWEHLSGTAHGHETLIWELAPHGHGTLIGN
ncbi:hypothetical protein AVEN_87130-1 [Araneus ventricosus]|uniref:Uncharacterized protein n=1 Tax=Araneus ventricosus TaxID=182803 RepID=A0A4Y2PQQ0_ARAVE|nr:hypothetical protein AVEN_87130-1 [Araneus ventricosus]